MGKPRHGHALVSERTKTYMVWVTMRQRCENPNAKDFPRYGGRGIAVCERWSSFENFLADMGPAPKGLTLDRNDNDGPYCKDNCRWLSHPEQQRNKRTSRKFEVNGQLRNVSDIEVELGLSQGAIWHRLKSGWPIEKAVTTRRAA